MTIPNMNSPRWRFSFWYFLASLLLIVLLQQYRERDPTFELSYSEVKQAIAANQARTLTLRTDAIHGQIHARFLSQLQPKWPLPASVEWLNFHALRVPDPELVGLLDAQNIHYTAVADSTFWQNLLGWIFPLLMMILLWQLIFSRMGGGSGMLSIGKSKARVYVAKDISTGFKDVAGIDEAVEELREVVSFLTEPGRYTKLGGRLPKGILLVGPPGTGKTLLARAVAGEAKVPFFSLSGSEFVEMFVGVGAARVRDLFEQAQKTAPCIIFIDELDALGRARGVAQLHSNEEREQTLNQLLTEMDGFDPNRGVVLMAATNRPEILDPALLRAGRFDRQVVVDKPDLGGRLAILKIHAGRVQLAPEVDLSVIAARTPGFVGADLENIVNEAALLAARNGKSAVALSDLEEAIDRILGGLQKKSRVMTPAEKHRVAQHEAGHALIAMLLPDADPLHKISIIPRGIAALGFTVQLPAEDRHLYTQSELLARIAVLLGGRAAEQLVFGESSTGAADDLQKATQLARRLVSEFGMSAALGPIAFTPPQSLLLGPLPETGGQFSEQTARTIDREVQTLIQARYAQVQSLLEQYQPALRLLAETLERQETLDGEAARQLLAPWFNTANDNGKAAESA